MSLALPLLPCRPQRPPRHAHNVIKYSTMGFGVLKAQIALFEDKQSKDDALRNGAGREKDALAAPRRWLCYKYPKQTSPCV